MDKVVIIGAGRLGKGFVGETFENADWDITFIDKNQEVIDNLNKENQYYVTVHRVDRIDHRIVKGYRAFTWKDKEVIQSICNTDLITIVIYPEDYKEAVPQLCNCLKERIKINPTKKLTIICITNKNHMMEGLNKDFLSYLGAEGEAWFKNNVALRDSIIRRSTDASNNVSTEIRTTAVLSLLIQGPVYAPVEKVEWMEVADKIELLKDIKVNIVNGPHASTAFCGYYYGYDTINQTLEDPKCASFVAEVTKEIKEGILKEYPITTQELDNLSLFPTAKGDMVDYIYRVAFDPVRKLGRNDRLTGSAMMCLEKNVDVSAITMAIAYGFLYDNPEDSNALEIQKSIKIKGIEKTVSIYCGLPEEFELVKNIVSCYRILKSMKK